MSACLTGRWLEGNKAGESQLAGARVKNPFGE